MNVNKLIALIIILLIVSTAFGLYNDSSLLVLIGHIFTLPLVGVWYGFKRRWSVNSIDKLMYFAFLVGSFSDSFILFGGEVGGILQILMTTVMHTALIIVFRKEGTRIYSDNAKDLPKLLIPVTIIFVFFGIVMIPILPDAIYFIAIFYAIQLMVLISHGLFRSITGKSYLWVAAGTSLIIVKDALYCYNFYVYKNQILNLYIIEYSLSTIVYFMIAVGVALGQKNNGIANTETVWQFIKNHIKLLFSFNNLTHIQKRILPKSPNSFQQNLLPKTQTN